MEGEGRSFVSVVIPLYNQSKYIGEAICSALDQTYKNYEIIVVDDGSSDSSQGVVARFAEQVKYIYQENQGLAGARNTGIRAAKGEFIALLDADDLWLPEFLETMVSLANQNPGAAVYYCCAQGMDESDNDLPQVFGGPPVPPSLMYDSLLRADFLIPSTILFRRQVVMAAGLFDPSLRSCEDWDLWLRLLPTHDFIGTSACLVRYRLHGSSLTTNLPVMQEAVRSVMEKHFGADDEQPHLWSQEKRRAYGGVYVFHTLTSVQLLNDWEAAEHYFQKALQIDPSLSTDLDFFYDLSHGAQPRGYRNSSFHLDLDENVERLNQLLTRVFSSSKETELKIIRRRSFGTAYFALGLIAYNTGKRSISRQLLAKALFYRPELWRDKRVVGNSIKSLLSQSTINWIKKFQPQTQL